jgi:hypothetical protein
MKHYTFLNMEEAFPIDNITAKWIVGLGIIHNDLLYIKKRLNLNSRKRDVSLQIAELPSLIRLVSASLREAIFYLEESEKEEKIKEYITALPENIIKIHKDLKPLFRNGEDSGILQRLTNIRNVTFHYSKPYKDEISKAIEAIHKRSLILYDYDREHFLFAEAISNTIMVQALLNDEEIEKQQASNADEIVKRIHKAFFLYIDFANQVVRFYLKDFCK